MAVHLPIAADDEIELARPRTRGDCARVPRPCPFVSCRWSTFPELEAAGVVTEPDEVNADASCVLDVAAREGASLDDVGAAIGLPLERARFLILRALKSLERGSTGRVLEELAGDAWRDRTRGVHVVVEPPALAVDEGLDEQETEEVGAFARVLGDDDEGACATVYRIYERASRERAAAADVERAGSPGDEDLER